MKNNRYYFKYGNSKWNSFRRNKNSNYRTRKNKCSIKKFNEIWKTIQEPAKINDRITYTITVRNTGDIDGKTTVKDEDLKGILADGKAEMVGEVSILKDEEIVSKNKISCLLPQG